MPTGGKRSKYTCDFGPSWGYFCVKSGQICEDHLRNAQQRLHEKTSKPLLLVCLVVSQLCLPSSLSKVWNLAHNVLQYLFVGNAFFGLCWPSYLHSGGKMPKKRGLRHRKPSTVHCIPWGFRIKYTCDFGLYSAYFCVKSGQICWGSLEKCSKRQQ